MSNRSASLPISIVPVLFSTPNNLAAMIAVSYTHLDVYKRQGIVPPDNEGAIKTF